MKDSQKTKIIKNAVQCLVCNEIIESKHRHDFVECKCGNIAVDGGHDYLRRVGNYDQCVDLSEFENSETLIY